MANNYKKYDTSSVGGSAPSTKSPSVMQRLERAGTRLRKAVVKATIGAASKPKVKVKVKVTVKPKKPSFGKQTAGKIKGKHKKMEEIY